jgi:hypothetical protein
MVFCFFSSVRCRRWLHGAGVASALAGATETAGAADDSSRNRRGGRSARIREAFEEVIVITNHPRLTADGAAPLAGSRSRRAQAFSSCGDWWQNTHDGAGGSDVPAGSGRGPRSDGGGHDLRPGEIGRPRHERLSDAAHVRPQHSLCAFACPNGIINSYQTQHLNVYTQWCDE